ncbi:hypothetical protein FNV43_RR09222 [Rhamnella rubrinervis]|uniref:C2 domain-containing protein n=1 Tax=Rhamnella rubrinervis TaxID=2594499 RepID=A0A8K0HAA1_9ROSA|nr:hypothetical protein FNV43_RR09222 [Rhamnella rubrinervis]
MLKHNHLHHQPNFTMEITVISAQGLKSSSSILFSHRLRPFITLTTVPPSCPNPFRLTRNGDKGCHLYTTKVDDEGGINPTWGDKFHVPVDSAFFTNRYSCLYLQLYTKRLVLGQTQLGWCQIPAQDIGFPPAGAVRYLSYRLRARDGSRTQGILNLAVRLEGQDDRQGAITNSISPTLETCQTVIGIPVTQFSTYD